MAYKIPTTKLRGVTAIQHTIKYIQWPICLFPSISSISLINFLIPVNKVSSVIASEVARHTNSFLLIISMEEQLSAVRLLNSLDSALPRVGH